MQNLEQIPKPYTFDRVVRLIITSVVVICVLLLINRLSGVLVPFFIALFIVYVTDPFVLFIQRSLRVKSRLFSVIIALLGILSMLFAFIVWVVPLFVKEMVRLGELLSLYVQKVTYDDIIPTNLQVYFKDFIEKHQITEFLDPNNLSNLLEYVFSHMNVFVNGSFQVFGFLTTATIVLLYVIFLLLDFENLNRRWPFLLPYKYRKFAVEIVGDMENGMHTYFRLQGLIALIVGVLLSIGFEIMGLPMGVIMGLVFGVLNMVPYLYLIGLIPALMLAMLGALDSGNSFLHEATVMLLIVATVQLFQDLYLIPKIMGKAYGLNPALIILSLSVWGSLLGFIGLLLALPLTSIFVSYYKRYILHHAYVKNGITMPPDKQEDDNNTLRVEYEI